MYPPIPSSLHSFVRFYQTMHFSWAEIENPPVHPVVWPFPIPPPPSSTQKGFFPWVVRLQVCLVVEVILVGKPS